ncbi:hypothetical protein TanjilG_21219 [Lupinus angustifolius]|uniref:Uncharacterized protein n=1 Tax=Lupinus angustifolius TaxID=3871 RepID=A0A4P1R8J7_LUPAN|nr:PREDICTED: uncharacterized protein LOC109355838 [Lupinus angustifolius]OIW05234.1 hypothetical protein TanjilG_21219 [Lupinus angustifolius]
MSILQYPEATSINSTQLHVWNNAAFDSTKENINPISESNIDDEIQEIENEMKRLSSKLEALRLHKAKTVEKKGRVVSSKFMEPKIETFVKGLGEESVKNKIEETPKTKVKNFNNMIRRGLSLGPSEIVRSRKVVDDAVTPVTTMQSRRKSCFLKPPEVDDERVNSILQGQNRKQAVTTDFLGSRKVVDDAATPVTAMQSRRKSCFLKPPEVDDERVNSILQGQNRRQTATTDFLGSRKFLKKEEEVLALVNPRKLFKEGGKSVPNKKLLKTGRVVASRYNQINSNSVAIDARKRLGQSSAMKLPLSGSVTGKRVLPENDKDDSGGRCDKRRASSVRVKKRWEIPGEVKKPSLSSSSSSSSSVMLPKIKALRCSNESARDSGAAKRVAELTGKRSYFCADNDADESVCKFLNLEEEEEEE